MPGIVKESIPKVPSLVTLLSRLFMAYAIELDNEFEHSVPHTTTENPTRSPNAVWLTSAAMWFSCLRFVGQDAITVGELEKLARMGTNLDGMRRWGYVHLDTGPKGQSNWILRATSRALLARKEWPRVFAKVESRWVKRFGAEMVGYLSKNLQNIVDQSGVGTPDWIPILGYGYWTRGRWIPTPPDHQEFSVPVLLAKTLLLFCEDFESASIVSLPIAANILQVIPERELPMRDLPLNSGISKEAVSMALGVLQKLGLVVVQTFPTKGKTVILTEAGEEARLSSLALLGETERAWSIRFGQSLIEDTRKSLVSFLAKDELIAEGIKPYPDGWRARRPAQKVLPRFPVVLHRGGYPDGS